MWDSPLRADWLICWAQDGPGADPFEDLGMSVFPVAVLLRQVQVLWSGIPHTVLISGDGLGCVSLTDLCESHVPAERRPWPLRAPGPRWNSGDPWVMEQRSGGTWGQRLRKGKLEG